MIGQFDGSEAISETEFTGERQSRSDVAHIG
jgi:hypothetical protein